MKNEKDDEAEREYMEVGEEKDGKGEAFSAKKKKETMKADDVKKGPVLKEAPKAELKPPNPPKPPEKRMPKKPETLKDIAKKEPEQALELPKPPVEKKIENPKEVSAKKEAGKVKADVRDTIQTDVDKLYEFAKEKGIVKVKDAAKVLNIGTEQVEEWGRILEEHKLVRLRYPPVGDPVIILKKFTAEKEKIREIFEKKKLRPAKRVFVINMVILLSFAALIAFYTIRVQTIRITLSQAYLATGVIILLSAILIFAFVIKRVRKKKNEAKGPGKDGEGSSSKERGGSNKNSGEKA